MSFISQNAAFITVGSCSGGNDSDGYLATVARDLGLDGGELNAMLADIGAGEGENGDFLRDQALPGMFLSSLQREFP